MYQLKPSKPKLSRCLESCKTLNVNVARDRKNRGPSVDFDRDPARLDPDGN